ncbi:uncharacterized protein LOC120251750 [Dioscorea cayenensis subsp. rotundata]|uniref:Uncharacterized protein LOC120251750 n=1 Tax=Dioscorea cayennensis subsp. rotundata TaxID=55577 RepID=A0AB40AMT0_DIOCR|nr:uncharacterized protein LOC120251750 [Dioscorea cayenensis subsp. rotundata]
MDIIDIIDPVKAEKETAIKRYRRIRTIRRLFRCLEACAAILIISWSSARLPAAARLSGDLLRSAAAILLSPRFVFLLGNAIVLVLFAKSGNLSTSPTSTASTPLAGDLYDDFLETRGSYPISPPGEADVVVYEDKAVCVETKIEYRRTISEKMEKKQSPVELRRSETDLGRKPTEIGKNAPAPAAVVVEDDDEFRKTIEAFIERQLKFHREESMTIVSAMPLNSDLIKYE